MTKKVGLMNLGELIAKMEPILNDGEYVFSSVSSLDAIPREITICEIKEKEGLTVIVSKENAEKFGLQYEYVASWITLNVYSSLEAVGLTAAFSSALSSNKISCNVVVGFYHDHIFVNKKDESKALHVLLNMTKKRTVA